MNNENLSRELKVVPITDTILLTEMEYTLAFRGEEFKRFLSDLDVNAVGLSLKQKGKHNPLTEDDFYRVGVLLKILDIEHKEQHVLLKVKALERVEVKSLTFDEQAVVAEYQIVEDLTDLDANSQTEMLNYMKKIVHEIGSNFRGSEPFVKMIDNENDLNRIMCHLGEYMHISGAERQGLIEARSLKERSLKFLDYLIQHKESIKLQFEVAEKFTEKANKMHRETVLREHLRAIQEELNEGEEGSANSPGKDYREKIEAAGMPDEVKKTALEEVAKFESQNPNSPDYNIIRNYLDILVELPWQVGEPKEIDLEEARKILNEQHYGLEKVKDRIIQHLAVMKLKHDKKGSILLLVGPPGTGKTSLGRSVAEALGRKYIRVSLGGIKDEAEIRGHRRTYIGALPGRIIQNMRKAGEKNPVFVLDEVDKLMAAYNGDPASALLEVLDPEQNNSFTDHYLEVPYDLSEVFFIATANSLDSIPTPLLDRMETIVISSYTAKEKYHIAREHLVKAVLTEHGLSDEQLVIEDQALRSIISDYTLEAGVRGLRRQIAAISRVASEKIVSHKVQLPYVVGQDMLEEILGNQVSRHDLAQADNPPGVVTGLAWTPVGGEILFIEGTAMPGTGQLTLTGKLGDVMKESARISLSLVKSRLAISTISYNFKERDLHIHVPSGAVAKDGPSAGIALFTAIASLITGIKVDPKLAMTGEITLRGAVLPVGGVKEKLLAAHRAGITKVLIPKENMRDLKELPEEVLEQLTIKPVEVIEDVLKETMGITLAAPEIVMEHGFIHEAPGNNHNPYVDM
ncbi:MAG TPA: endopeptidase La [Syntrophomonadaceae bacterium]|nr:endopeptidase La [Syntrophomonadaceae bacterium]